MADRPEAEIDLFRDVQDGGDLSLAMQLVADALDRRLERLQRSARRVIADGHPGVVVIAEELRRTMAAHRDGLDRHRTQLQESIDALQDALERSAAELPDG